MAENQEEVTSTPNLMKMVVTWLLQQGTSTILLCLVAFGLYREVPLVFARLADEIERERTLFRESIEKLSVTIEKEMDKLTVALKDNNAPRHAEGPAGKGGP